jgi:hypothetical protein
VTRGAAIQLQVRHVDRGDEQHASHGAEEHVQRARVVGAIPVVERLDPNRKAVPRERHGTLRQQRPRHGVELGACLIDRDTVREAGDDAGRIAGQHVPGIGVDPRGMGVEAARHHAHDDVAPARGRARHPPADDRRIAAEEALPQTVADHEPLRAVPLHDRLVIPERTAQHRLHAEQPQGAAVDLLHEDSLGAVGTGDGEVHLAHERVGGVLERPALAAPRLDNLRRHAARLAVGVDALDPHQPGGSAERQRRHHHGVEHAEDRAGGANAQRERDAGDGGERAIPRQQAQPVPGITRQRLEPADAVHVVDLLAHEERASEPAPRRRARLLPGHAQADVAVGEQVEMRLEFALNLVVHARTGERVAQARDEREERGPHLRAAPPAAAGAP